MEEDLNDSCAQCGTKQNAASNLNEQIFRVNTAGKCGHKFCQQCVEREFSKKRQFSCPKCKTTVTLDKLSLKSLDETEVERDYSIRKKIKAIFNKTPNDFRSLSEFKDYEEEVEDIIYKLANQIDVEETNKKVEAYKQLHQALITQNQHKKSEEIRSELSTIAADAEEKRRKFEKMQSEQLAEQASKKEHKKQLNQLMLGEYDNKRNVGLSQIASTAPTVAAPTPLAPSATVNVAQQFFAQRPEPLPIMDSNKRRKCRTSEDLRTMHRVGGYDHADYQNRNWFEIRSQLQSLSRN